MRGVLAVSYSRSTAMAAQFTRIRRRS